MVAEIQIKRKFFLLHAGLAVRCPSFIAIKGMLSADVRRTPKSVCKWSQQVSCWFRFAVMMAFVIMLCK